LTTESASRANTEPPPGTNADATPGRRPGPLAGAAFWFFAVELLALPLLLIWGRHGWFTQDDWDFLSARTAGNIGDLFRAHFQHWTTLPVLVYRLMWVLFGMRSYTPYQVLSVVTHLVAAALVLVVMRRAGVRPWVATVAAVTFVFFGSGAENILVAFQITFTGALVFGLSQLLLADHDGPIDRRDWAGLLAGFCGLACSGVALTMTVVVALAVLLRRGRRGWRVALFHAAPLAVAYALWSKLAPKGQNAENYRSHSPAQILRFVAVGIEAAFARLGQVPGIGIALGLVLGAGLVVLFRARTTRWPLGELAAPIALLVGGIVFLIVTGVARAGQGGLLVLATGTGPERARDSRYVYLIAAMALPALALGVDALARRWKQLTVPAVALLLVGLPGNIYQLATPSSRAAKNAPLVWRLPPFGNAAATREQILAIPHLPFADQLAGSDVPVPIPRLVPEGLTFGWLLGGAASGKIPGPGTLNPFFTSTYVRESFLASAPAPNAPHCAPAPAASILVLQRGRKLTVERGNVVVRYAPFGGTPSFPVTIRPSTVVALAGPLRLRIVPLGPGVMLCE